MAAGWFLLARVAKFVFVLSTIAGTAYVVKEVTSWTYEQDDYGPLGFRMEANDLDMGILDENYIRCIKSPSKEFCLVLPKNRMTYLKAQASPLRKNSAARAVRGIPSTSSKPRRGRHHPLEAMAYDFSGMTADLEIPTVLIEPSILFCMLSVDNKRLLLKRDFNLASVLGTPNVISFAAKFEDAAKLELPMIQQEIKNRGFAMHRAQESTIPGRLYPSSGAPFLTHSFFVRRMIVVHLVVLYEMKHYFHHGPLNDVPSEINVILSKNDLLFINDSIYDKFSFVSVGSNDIRHDDNLKIPSNPTYFLHQTRYSRVIRCRGLAPTSDANLTLSGIRAKEILKTTFLAASPYLHSMMKANLMDLILFDETLLGWYKYCDVTPHTTAISFLATAADINDGDFRDRLSNSSCSGFIQTLSQPDEAYELSFGCFPSVVKLLFKHDTSDGFWIPRHNSEIGYYTRRSYPTMKVCSTYFLGQRALVPCEPDKILLIDYRSSTGSL